VWECPQLVELDGRRLLIVSVQVDGTPGPVMATVRSADGPWGPWQRLVHGPIGYATSAFRDRDGRLCVISWLQEDPLRRRARPWAGAESLVAVLTADPAGTIALSPHPEVARSHWFTSHAVTTWPWVVDVADRNLPATQITAAADEPIDVGIRAGSTGAIRIRRSPTGERALSVERPGLPGELLPLHHPGKELHLFLDADILEVYCGGSFGVWRVPFPLPPDD
jgi:sucrose-6-phosphate hydrolase SacC (GH32 family)